MKVFLTPKEVQLYNDCVHLNGVIAQLEQYAEECLEAALAARKYLRSLKHDDNIEQEKRFKDLQSEIADTLIMSTQMHSVLNGPDQEIDTVIDFKIQRQCDRVDTEKAKRYSKHFNPLDHENQK